jgi:hypothetical protein
MSGTYRRLAPGRYQLLVETGEGPAGVRRPDGHDIVVGVEGGQLDFAIPASERVYYWWRGPTPREGVRLVPLTRAHDSRSLAQAGSA